jgi:hypothetical protein
MLWLNTFMQMFPVLILIDKNLRCLSLKFFNLHGEEKWISMQLSDPFLCLISTSIDTNYINFVIYSLKDSHFLHVCNC